VKHEGDGGRLLSALAGRQGPDRRWRRDHAQRGACLTRASPRPSMAVAVWLCLCVAMRTSMKSASRTFVPP